MQAGAFFVGRRIRLMAQPRFATGSTAAGEPGARFDGNRRQLDLPITDAQSGFLHP